MPPLPRLFDLVVVRQRRVFAAVALTAFAIAAVVTFALPKQYRAEATLFVGENRSVTTGAGAVQLDEQLARTYVALLRTPEVTQAVVRALPFDLAPSALEPKVDVAVPTGTRLIRIGATDASPRRAQALADAYATTFVDGQRTASAATSSRQLAELRTRIGNLGQLIQRLQRDASPAAAARRSVAETELQSARDAYVSTQRSLALSGADISVASRATLPGSPSRPRPKLFLALGLLVALALAGAAAAFADRFDDRLRDEGELLELLGAPVLARVPLQTAGHEAATREAFDLLRANLSAEAGGRDRLLAVTSALPGEGKTFAVGQLASAFARLGNSVVAVDCDLRRRALGTAIGTPGARGVTTLLVESHNDALDLVGPTSLPGVRLLAAGPSAPNSPALLGMRRMGEVFDRLGERYEHVVVDSAPVTVVADTTALAAAVDAVVVVVDLDRAGRRALKEAAAQLRRAGTPIAGIVLNRVAARAFAYEPYGADGAGAVVPSPGGREAGR